MCIIFSGLQLHGGRQEEDGKRRELLLKFTFDDNGYVFPESVQRALMIKR